MNKIIGLLISAFIYSMIWHNVVGIPSTVYEYIQEGFMFMLTNVVSAGLIALDNDGSGPGGFGHV
jgi:hypothetical protein